MPGRAAPLPPEPEAPRDPSLLGDLSLVGSNPQYATGSRAFTETRNKIIGTRGGSQFSYFNNYAEADVNAINVLICDETHRIRETSSNRYTPKEKRSTKSQVDEILDASKVCVFFVDDSQAVRSGYDLGSGSQVAFGGSGSWLPSPATIRRFHSGQS